MFDFGTFMNDFRDVHTRCWHVHVRFWHVYVRLRMFMYDFVMFIYDFGMFMYDFGIFFSVLEDGFVLRGDELFRKCDMCRKLSRKFVSLFLDGEMVKLSNFSFGY